LAKEPGGEGGDQLAQKRWKKKQPRGGRNSARIIKTIGEGENPILSDDGG